MHAAYCLIIKCINTCRYSLQICYQLHIACSQWHQHWACCILIEIQEHQHLMRCSGLTHIDSCNFAGDKISPR